MSTITGSVRAFALGLVTLLLASCAAGGSKPDAKLLDQTLEAYAAAVRWNGLDASTRYLDPDQVAAHPPPEFDLERLRQVEVTSYKVLSRTPTDPSHVVQTVEIELSNKNNQTVRTVRVSQKWQFDDKRRRWWLGGLPDISAK